MFFGDLCAQDLLEKLFEDFEYVKNVLTRDFVGNPEIKLVVPNDLMGTAKAIRCVAVDNSITYKIEFFQSFVVRIAKILSEHSDRIIGEYGDAFYGNRHELANNLFNITMKGVFYHELSHILNGHLDALAELIDTGSAFISECDAAEKSDCDAEKKLKNLPAGHKYFADIDDENRVRDFAYKLECEADLSSSRYLVVELARIHLSGGPVRENANGPASMLAGLSFISCAVTVMFLVFNQSRQSKSQVLNSIYPPPSFRFLMIVNYMREEFLSMAGSDQIIGSWIPLVEPEHIHQTVWDGMSVAMEIAEKASLITFTREEMEIEREKWVNGGAQSINEIREFLWPYTFECRFKKQQTTTNSAPPATSEPPLPE